MKSAARRWRWCALALGLSACASPVRVVPRSLVGVPEPGDEAERLLEFAREHFDRGDIAEAVRVTDAVLAEDGTHLCAQRLRQDILRERGRKGVLLVEAEQRLRAHADSPGAHYLRGRIAPAGAPQVPHFERALALEPQFFWAWLGLGWSLRRTEPERALAIYRQLHDLAPDNRLVATNLANALADAGRGPEAAKVYSVLRTLEGGQAVSDLGMARLHVQQDARSLAWAPLLNALRLRPFDAGVRALLEGLMLGGASFDRLEQVRDVLYQDPARLATFLLAGGRKTLADLFVRLCAPHAARDALTVAGQPPLATRERRLWRRMVLLTGDVATYLADLQATIPASLLRDERNQVRGRWVAVLQAGAHPDADLCGDPVRALELVSALRDVGKLAEADIVATHAIVRLGDGARTAALRDLRDDVRKLLAFEGAVRRVLYEGYALKEPRSLPETFGELRRVALEILGADVVGEPRTFKVPFVGELMDPFGPGLPQHFARYNKHLVFGQRNGMAPEAMLLTRVSLRDVEDDSDVPVPVRAREIVGEEKSIEARTSLVGGDIAGVALIDNYVVDMDAVHDWAESLLRMRRIARQDDLALLADPLPKLGDALDPIDAEWRLAAVAPLSDGQLVDAVLDVIRWHERAHLSDTFYFLPPESNLWRVLGLLLRNSLRATSVEADLEMRAELAALAKSPHTEIVLAHIAGFCNQSLEGFSPHASGFERLARGLQRRLVAAGLSEEQVAVSRWGTLDVAKVRDAARAMLRQLW
jgi:hypothetical protein